MRLNKRTGIWAGLAALMTAVIAGVMLLPSNVIEVPVGGDLQAALNSARCGDTIILSAGAAYVGPFTLAKACSAAEPITIQSSRAAELPPSVLVSPAQAALMAWLQSRTNAEPVIKTAAGAHGYKGIGLQISTADASVFVYDLVRLGEGRETQKTLDVVPGDFTFDRCWIHGWDTQDSQRGVSLNSSETTITNCYISDIHGVGFDTQAIAGWNGPGPYHIINNYLEGAGENILFGGADPGIPNLVPSDIEIRRNYVFKPLTWKIGDPSYAGRHWTIKNLLELKNARRVVIDGNLFANCWTDGQTGIPILFTVRNQDGTALWSIIEDVTFTNNIVRGAEGALNLLGSDNERPSQRSIGLRIANNLFTDIRGPFLTMNGYYNVTLDGNTFLQSSNTAILYGEPSLGMVWRNSLTDEKPWGIFGEGGLIGADALDRWAPGHDFFNNVMAHSAAFRANVDNPYPTGNWYPDAIDLTADYRSSWNAIGAGADIDVLNAAQAGKPPASPSPSPTASASLPPSPSPTATATATPTPSPTPSPTPKPSPLPMCKPNQVVGKPAVCVCPTMLIGNPPRCKPLR